MDDCVFCKIIKGEIPTNFVYQDDNIAVFEDINKLKPVHLLLIPKAHVGDYTLVDESILMAIKNKITDLVKDMDLMEKGYRIEVNGGAAMGVPHLHFHLLAPIKIAEPV